jgi:hypothetical protein
MKLEQFFTIEENDLREIIADLLVKRGLKFKDGIDDITVSINTNRNSIDGPVEIGRTWGYLNSGVVIHCEVENI